MEGIFKTSDNVNVFYQLFNPGKGKVIFLVHGFQVSGRFFQQSIEPLSLNYTLVIMDVRGHGHSERIVEDCSQKRCGQDIYELICFLGLKNVYLLGWSMGGNIAMEYFKQYHSQYLSTIGILDSRLFPFSGEDWNTHSCRNYNVQRADERKYQLLENYERYCRTLTSRYFVRELEKEVQCWIEEELLKMDKRIAWKFYEDFLEDDCYSILSEIDIPVLILATRHIGDDTGRHYHDRCQNSQYHFLKCGHCFMIEEPDLFNQLILEFVKAA